MSESTGPFTDKTVSLDTTQAISGPVTDRTQMSIGITCPVCSTANGPAETYCIDCGFMLSSAPVTVEDVPVKLPAKLISVDGTREFPLKQGSNTVGRKDSDVLIADGTVSRDHAIITVEGSVVQVTDVGSTNGTQVDRIAVGQEEPIALTDGCEVRFGSITLKFLAAPEPEILQTTEAVYVDQNSSEEASETPAETITSENMTQDLEVVFAEEVINKYGVLRSKDGMLLYEITKQSCTVGRRDTNDIIVADPFCSGSHARLECENGHVSIVDIGSSNGTQVNGILLEVNQPRELAFGDELTIGQTALVFEEA